MTAAAPTISQIKARVATIPEKSRRGKAVGIHCAGRWGGESPVSVDGRPFVIRQCDSPLAMRLALREPAGEDATKILLTPLREQDLGEDVLLRLAKRRLFEIESWQIVRQVFAAQAVDPRLTRHPWLAEVLLEWLPGEVPAARGGFLDAETVWALLLGRAMGLTAATADLTALLKWSLDTERAEQFRGLPEAFRNAAVDWLAERAGPAARAVLRCAGRLERPDAVPIGLAAGVIYHPAAAGRLEKASGKLEERYLGGQTPGADLVLRWSAAATEVVRSLRHIDAPRSRQTLQRFDDILREVQADEYAHLSDTSPLGFDQRLARFGERLSDILQRQAWGELAGLDEACHVVREHDRATREARQVERAEMALRLARWLAADPGQDESSPRSLADAAGWYLREGGHVDWARLCLRTLEPVPELSAAYAKLFEQVRERRERQSQAFARLLADWTAAGSKGGNLLPVERILDEIVAPLARERHVLVVVIDGMSVAVCRELLADLTRHDWTPLGEPGREFTRPGLAAIPSVTEFSRASLLCGQVCQGKAADEAQEFAEHPALVAASRSNAPPVLFHKADIQESGETVLAQDVRDAIQSTHRRAVGVVVNAVDDHLAKGDQIDTRWSRDEIRVLPALLHEARMARRLVVLLSDHGHVLDCHAEGRTGAHEGDAGERYRSAAGEPTAEEILIKGHRVLTEDHRVIAPWSERVRYGMKKNGYHGGVSPQEMVVPVVVLSSTDELPAGWGETPIDTPAWWDEPVGASMPKPKKSALRLKPVRPKPPGKLFDLEAEEQAAEPEPVAGPSAAAGPEAASKPEWVVRLLASPVFADQKRLGGRGVPSDEVFARLLGLLDGRGGKLTSPALARALRLAPVRLPGLLAKAERVLNVDGYDILRRDDVSDTVELNRELLLGQFDLVE